MKHTNCPSCGQRTGHLVVRYCDKCLWGIAESTRNRDTSECAVPLLPPQPSFT